MSSHPVAAVRRVPVARPRVTFEDDLVTIKSPDGDVILVGTADDYDQLLVELAEALGREVR